ncbi:MAG: divalent cation tolerance protein CutA [candidate division Zixibacteria bacterium]|nr:divalent cation tolerance protein CutA [candidate division Zixibacteria bacterium]
MSAVVVFCTTGSKEEAESIAADLVKSKTAACCNILSGINSIYFWEGEVCNDSEYLLIIKTSQDALEMVTRRIGELHSYDLPEIIAMPIIGGSDEYIKWVENNSGGE